MGNVSQCYSTGLRDQHAIQDQAVETIEAQLNRTQAYPELHARLNQELDRSRA